MRIGIVAQYVGEDGFQGFATGQRYHLIVRGHQIIRRDDTGMITYNSLESFFSDWIVSGVG